MSQDPSNELVPLDDDLDLIDDEEDEHEPTAEEIASEIASKSMGIARLTAEAAQIAAEPIEGADSTALMPTNVSASQAKAQLATVRATVMRRQMELESRREEIVAMQREVEELMYAQKKALEEFIAPMQKQIDRLNEGVWMVNLYLGRDEEIVSLYDGEPAPANEKVAIRQMVLAMDEESALDPEDDGIDATNIDEFDKWLQKDWKHVEQVAPEPKCVVALRPRRPGRGKHYEDPWKQHAVDEANKQTYFLIRNGANVYRTWTEFNVGDRLVPNGDEFTAFFYETRHSYEPGKQDIRVPIQPGTLAWERAEEEADARKRHYMRVGLILQGLVDRTTVFHPLPEGYISFLDFEHNDRSWRFVLDAEMALSTGRQPFREWLAERNAQLQVGMRIVGAFSSHGFRQHDMDHGYRNARVRPPTAKKPKSGVLHVIEDEESGAFVIRYERDEDIYDPKMWRESDRPGWGYRGGSRKPQKRASCLLYRDDRFILPFDLVSEEEMVEYLGARLDRHAYADMFPLLKAAIRAKRAEREEEAPFRTMLAGVLARDNGVEVADAEADIDSLVEWYKLANKNHRPLVGDEESQAKAVRMIVAEHARRLKARAADREIVDTACTLHPDALLVGRKRDGRYVVIVPEDERNVFVAEYEYGARALRESTVGSVLPAAEKRWMLMPPKSRRVRWHVAYTSERFEEWDFNAKLDDHLTGPEFAAMVDVVMADKGENVLAVAYDAEAHEFHTWRLDHGALVSDRPLRSQPKEPGVEHVERKWKRERGDAILRGESKSWRSASSYQRKPWDTRARGTDKRFSDNENRYTVLHVDEKNETAWRRGQARYKSALRKREAMEVTVRAYLASIRAAWVRRREAEEYQRFIEDFQDTELWEGHRKTLPRDTFEYPHNHFGRGYMASVDAVALLVEYAVESGIDLAGMTVWDATEHFPRIEWLRARLGTDRDDRIPEAIDIPADIRDLTFRLIEPEE